jgi:hypothetical protein
VQLILIGPAPAVAIATGVTCDKAAFLQGSHVPKSRCAAHLAFVRQPLGAWVALAGFIVVKIRKLNQNNLGGGFETFDIRGPNQCQPAHSFKPRTVCEKRFVMCQIIVMESKTAFFRFVSLTFCSCKFVLCLPELPIP